MSFGGSVAAMISSSNNNRNLLRASTHKAFEMIKPGSKSAGLKKQKKVKDIDPERYARYKERYQKELKKEKLRRVFLPFIVIGITAIIGYSIYIASSIFLRM